MPVIRSLVLSLILAIASRAVPLIDSKTAFGNTTTAALNSTGATLLAIFIGDNVFNGTVSDNKGNTYTRVGTLLDNALFYYACTSLTVGAGHTVTVAGGSGFSVNTFAAFSGFKCPLDQSNSTGVTALNPATAGPITPAGSGFLILTGFGNSGDLGAYSVAGSYTIINNTSYDGATHYGGASAYQVQVAAAAISAVWTSGLSGKTALIVSFPPSSSPTRRIGVFF